MPPEPDQERWSVVADDVFCPSAAAWGERGVSVFMRGASGELLVREREENAFGELRSLGVPVARIEGSRVTIPVEWPIAACSTRDGDIHLVARGVEGDLVHGRLRGKDWSGFESIGVPEAEGRGSALPMGIAGAPAACCRERGRLEVFAVAGEGDLLHTVHDATGFGQCRSLGGIGGPSRDAPVFGAISAFDAGLRAMGVVARGPSGDILVKLWTTQQQWRPFTPLRGIDEVDPLDPALEWMTPLTGPPAVCGGGSSRADVFIRGPRGHLFHASWGGERWTAFESLGAPATAAPDAAPILFTAGPIACAWGKFQLDVFVCAADGKLYHSCSNGTWRPRAP